MKTQNTLKIVVLTAITALALAVGCKKQEAHSEHDGHDHAKTNAPAQDDHKGHNHGPGEHATPPAK